MKKMITSLAALLICAVAVAGDATPRNNTLDRTVFAGRQAYDRDVRRVKRQYQLALEQARLEYLGALDRRLRAMGENHVSAPAYRAEIQRVRGLRQRQVRARLKVKSAKFGAGETFVDVAGKIEVADGRLSVRVNTENLGNPVSGKWKHLVLEIEHGSSPILLVVPQTSRKTTEPFSITFERSRKAVRSASSPHAAAAGVEVRSARWGFGDAWKDVQRRVKVDGNRLSIRVDNERLGNPAKGTWKLLELEIAHGGTVLKIVAPQTHEENRAPFSITFGS